MVRQQYSFVAMAITLAWSASANAFRSCENVDTYGFAAASQYVVGEIDFDEITGTASGTETIYNYSNQAVGGFSHCHVTYELSGSYLPGSEIFILDAQRSNISATCPTDFIDIQYPENSLYSLQMEFAQGGDSVVTNAASSEIMASGSWAAGSTTYKTDERCMIF